MMQDSEMTSFSEAIRSAFANIGNVDHVEAADGDYIADDGYLCCGVCGKHKEYRRNLPFREKTFVVPCLCDCGRKALEQEEREHRLQQERERVQELFQYSLADERFRESTFANLIETPDNAKAVRIAKNYVQHFDEMYAAAKGLILYGPTGTGKTYVPRSNYTVW